MKITEVPFSMTVEDTKTWMLVMQQLTSGGTPKENTRERWQKFRCCMMTNHQRLQAAWDDRAKEIGVERTLILVNICGSAQRATDYDAEMQAVFKAFGEYRNDQGKFEFKPGSAAGKRFSNKINEINAKFKDVGEASKKFAERQAEMLAEDITVKLVCCDYNEVPDDVGCAYIGFISKILMGMPKLRFWHAALLRESRNDPDTAQMVVRSISKAIDAAMEAKKTNGEIAMDVFRALYQPTDEAFNAPAVAGSGVVQFTPPAKA